MESGIGFFLWPLFAAVLLVEWVVNAVVSVASWLFETIGPLLPIVGVAIGVVSAIAAILSALVLFIPARRMSRAKRSWLRVIGWVLLVSEVIATLAFAGVAVIAFAAVAIYA